MLGAAHESLRKYGKYRQERVVSGAYSAANMMESAEFFAYILNELQSAVEINIITTGWGQNTFPERALRGDISLSSRSDLIQSNLKYIKISSE